MAISQVIAGAYSGAINSFPLNYTRRGFTLHFTSHAEMINETDTYSRTLLDMIYQGLDISVETICRVWNATLMNYFFPWGNTIGTVQTSVAPIARRGTDVASSLVLTAVPATPAAVFGANAPATFTGGLAILAPETDHALVFNSQARDIPISWNLLPAETGGVATKAVIS